MRIPTGGMPLLLRDVLCRRRRAVAGYERVRLHSAVVIDTKSSDEIIAVFDVLSGLMALHQAFPATTALLTSLT